VASITSVNALQASIAAAERQVQQDQSRVSQDASRLEQSRNQLTSDKQDLSSTREQGRAAERPALAPAPEVRLDSAIQKPSPAEQRQVVAAADLAAPTRPQVNAQGQTIGKLINIAA
jgi:hypothetical protein